MDECDALTEKQAEALELVCQHLQTKEIARILGISPRSVDQRIDGARQKLGAATRIEAARIFAARKDIPYRITGEPFTVPAETGFGQPAPQPQDLMRFEDVGAFVEQAPWDRANLWRIPELEPRDFGTVARLVTMVILAVALLLLVTLGLDLARSLGLMIRV